MADEKDDITSDQPQQPKKGTSKKVLIIVACVILVLGASGYMGYTMLSGGKSKGEEKEFREEKNRTKNILIPLDPFVVNLSDHGKYLKISMQFEITGESYQDLVKQKIPLMRDVVITHLSSKSYESILSPEGKFQLKDELLLRANQAIGKDIFRNLYFTDFVLQ